VLAEPPDLPTSRHWFIAKGSGPKEMAGWYNIDWNRGETQFFNRFRIVDSAESVAASKDFEENIGMITAIFYTVGMDNIPVARKRTRSLGKSMFGTGEGERVDQVLEKVQRSKRGIILAAMTYYYRSREEIQDLQSGGDGDDLVFTGLKDKKEADAVGDSDGSKSDDGDLIIIDGDK
jgi:hypothetical protein